MHPRSSLNHALLTPRGNNFFEFNLRAFKLCSLNLRDNLILDIGASNLALFSRHAALNGARIVNIDPLYMNVLTDPDAAVVLETVTVGAPELGIVKTDLPPLNANVAAIAKNIPIASNTFDIVVSFACVEYLPVDDYESSLCEMLRVTKPGGTIHLAPVASYDEYHPLGTSMYYDTMKYEAAAFESALATLGADINFHFFDFPEVDSYDHRGVIITKPT